MRKKQPKRLDWGKGIEDDIAFLAEDDPKAFNFALNHVPPSDLRRQWVMFDAKLGRLRQEAVALFTMHAAKGLEWPEAKTAATKRNSPIIPPAVTPRAPENRGDERPSTPAHKVCFRGAAARPANLAWMMNSHVVGAFDLTDLERWPRSYIQRIIDLVESNGRRQRRERDIDIKLFDRLLGPSAILLPSVNFDEDHSDAI
jgi:hypothetical protein